MRWFGSVKNCRRLACDFSTPHIPFFPRSVSIPQALATNLTKLSEQWMFKLSITNTQLTCGSKVCMDETSKQLIAETRMPGTSLWPLSLRAVRVEMIRAQNCRTEIDRRSGRIKRSSASGHGSARCIGPGSESAGEPSPQEHGDDNRSHRDPYRRQLPSDACLALFPGLQEKLSPVPKLLFGLSTMGQQAEEDLTILSLQGLRGQPGSNQVSQLLVQLVSRPIGRRGV